jgi:CubicO group peptidase (beta-lactamase class C family)
MPRAIIALVFVLGLVLPSTPPTIAAPIDDWLTTTPEEQGMDSAKLADALLAMQQEVPNLHSFLLIRDGKVVVDASFYPYDGTTPHDLASVTKSVMTTLIGIAIDQGELQLDDPVLSFFPDREVANRDERKERMTVRDLASMTSGLACFWQPDEPTLQEMEESADYVQFTLDLPMVAEPGTTWEYCSPGMHLLSAILTQATGMTALDFAYDTLFGPLGMREVIWPADPNGYNNGWGNLMLHPRDAAKLGQLWLNGGEWNGRRIVSAEWVEAAVTSKATTTSEGQDYGYGWWITREGAVGREFSARGRGGQYIAVFPDFNAFAMITGSGTYGPSDVTDLLLPALVDPTKAIPANPEGMAKLAETVAALSAPPDPTPVPALPPTAVEISGKTYTFTANSLGIVSFRLDFDQSAEARLTAELEGDSGPQTLPLGLDGLYRFTPGDYGFPLGLRGIWTDQQTFAVDYDMIASNDAILLLLSFADDTVTITASERTHEGAVQFEGTVVVS